MKIFFQKTTHIGAAILLLIPGLISFPVLSITPVRAEEVNETPSAVEGEKQMFLVSAYYSPLPGQKYYLRGNYEAEKRLNGNGTHGADGKPVYPGMLAAPKTYPFGTKIEIPGLGVGVVHDRGGAIREHDGYHRIDVWMGSGDEGLARALQWGMRKVEGVVYGLTDQVEEELAFGHIPTNTPVGLSKNADQNSTSSAILKIGARGDAVKALQSQLKQLGFFSAPATGNYGKITAEAVFSFQKAHNLVGSWQDAGAGTFGPKTQALLAAKINGSETALVESKQVVAVNQTLSVPYLETGLGSGSKGPEVTHLQHVLKNLGYFVNEPNGTYDTETIDAVFAFQQDQQIVQSANDTGAGYYGQKTNAIMTKVLLTKRQENSQIEKIQTILPEDTSDVALREKRLVFGENLKMIFEVF